MVGYAQRRVFAKIQTVKYHLIQVAVVILHFASAFICKLMTTLRSILILLTYVLTYTVSGAGGQHVKHHWIGGTSLTFQPTQWFNVRMTVRSIRTKIKRWLRAKLLNLRFKNKMLKNKQRAKKRNQTSVGAVKSTLTCFGWFSYQRFAHRHRKP